MNQLTGLVSEGVGVSVGVGKGVWRQYRGGAQVFIVRLHIYYIY